MSAPASAAEALIEATYGEPPAALAAVAKGAFQLSPLFPGGERLEALEESSASRIVVMAPRGTLERGYVLAQALRALATGGELLALAPKDRGGLRLRRELEAFGCEVGETARRHFRLCRTQRPAKLLGISEALAAGGVQWVPSLEMWSQPGIFSWDRLDRGSAVLLAQPWAPIGAGADLGCGTGVLARPLLRQNAITRLWLIDLDGRAVEAARRNLSDSRAAFLHHDLKTRPPGLVDLDFVVMNPPFHNDGALDRALSAGFVERAAQLLRPGGVCRLVANVALPYVALMEGRFSSVDEIARQDGYKVLEARR